MAVRLARLALISDQHGNDVAFKATVDEIERIGVDEIVCLGDVVQGGPEPAQTLERLAALGCRTVIGNADAFVVEGPEASVEETTERQLEIRAWTLEQLGPGQLEQIRAFEPVVVVELGGARIVCFHGSPTNYDDVLLPELDGASLEPFVSALPADVLAGGHTHRQWARRIRDALYVNPGSVGLPYGRWEPDERLRLPVHAEYGLVIVDELGVSVEFHEAQYSYADLERAAATSGRPYWRHSIAEWRAR